MGLVSKRPQDWRDTNLVGCARRPSHVENATSGRGLRDRLGSIADQEQQLIASLRDALNRFDQKLLQDVRNIAAEHEGRRSVILNELQGFASRLGVFPAASPARSSRVNGEVRSELSGPASGNQASLTNRLRTVESGAWREATDKLQNELETYFRKRA